MKFLITLFGKKTQTLPRTQEDIAQERLVEMGAEQFKKLLSKGLSVPVVLL